MVFVQSRVRAVFAHITPMVGRVLLHSMLFGLAFSIADVLFNFYLVSMGYTTDVVGLLSMINRIAGTIIGVPIGLLIDRIGAQRSLILGLFLYSIGWALLLTTQVLWTLCVTQFIIGSALILILTAVVPLLSHITRPDQRAAVFGMNASAMMVIGLLGSAVGGVLPMFAAQLIGTQPQDAAAYRLALITVVMLGLIAALPVLRLRAVVPSDTNVELDDTLVPLLSLRVLVRYSLAAFLMGIGGGLILPFQNLFFRQIFGLSDVAVGIVLACSAFGMGVGALLGAPVSARLGLRCAAALLRLCAVPAMLLMLVPMLFPAVIGYFFRGLFVTASFPLNDALVMQATPVRQRGLASSMMSVLWSLGWACTSFLSGWMQLKWGFVPILIGVAVFYLLSSVAIFTLRIDDAV